MRMDPRAPIPSSSAAERIVPSRRNTPSSAPIEATSVLLALGSEAPAPPLELPVSAPAVVALSEDRKLLQALTDAVIQRLAVVTCPSADRFVDQLVANGAEIAVIDAAVAPKPLDVFLLALHRQFPQLQLVVAGHASLQRELTAQLSSGTIFRFADRSACARDLQPLLFAALRQGQTLASPANLPGRRSDAARPQRRWLWALMLALTAVLAGAAGWLASAFAGRHLLP